MIHADESSQDKIVISDRSGIEIIAEINNSIARSNPNIGEYKTIFLKQGPLAFKVASIFQILDQGTKKHHHSVLVIQTYSRQSTKDFVIVKKDETKISLEDKKDDEIGLLAKFIDEHRINLMETPAKYGVMRKEKIDELTKAISNNSDVQSILEDEKSYKEVIEKGGVTLFKSMINWAASINNPREILNTLSDIQTENLQNIDILIGLARIKKALELWENNQENDSEEFWQVCIKDNSWLISQIFSVPTVLYEDKSFLGGKYINDKGGKVIDFLYKNEITSNVMLIEIKTPSSRLLGGKYRQTFSMSSEVSGAINQLLGYKQSLQREYNSLINNDPDKERFEAFCPVALLIVGSNKGQIESHAQKEAFELYRNNVKDIEIITFDELFAKAHQLIKLLEKGI